MSERVPCKTCGAMILKNTYDLTGGLCGRCAKGAKLCAACGCHVTGIVPDKDGRYLCDDCWRVGENQPNRVKSADLKEGVEAPCRVLSEQEIEHEILGRLRKRQYEWVSEPLDIGSLDCTIPVTVHTREPFPTSQQLAILAALVAAPASFKAELAFHLASHYKKWTLPAYLPQIGDARYSPSLTHDDLPQLAKDADIWKVLGAPLQVAMHGDDLAISFSTRFDTEHETTVCIRDGSVYEVNVGAS